MNRTQIFEQPAGIDVLLFSPPEETIFIVPTDHSKLSDRISRLENEARTTTEAITLSQGKLATLSTNIELLSDRTVSWKQLIGIVVLPMLGVAIACVLTFFLGAASLFNSSYNNRIPKDVEYGIATSPSLRTRFDNIDARFTKVDARLDNIEKLLATPTTVSAALKLATSVHQRSIATTLPRVRDLMKLARNMKVPLLEETYKSTYRRLFGYYTSSAQPLRQEVWETLIDCANTRTSTDVELHPVPESEIERARSTGNLFEDKTVDLSSSMKWKDSIFRNCKITITKPELGLNLMNVRFMDCEFQSVAENITNHRLIESVLESRGPELNVPKFKVLDPTYQKELREGTR